jgi:hypothetical protein
MSPQNPTWKQKAETDPQASAPEDKTGHGGEE